MRNAEAQFWVALAEASVDRSSLGNCGRNLIQRVEVTKVDTTRWLQTAMLNKLRQAACKIVCERQFDSVAGLAGFSNLATKEAAIFSHGFAENLIDYSFTAPV